MSNRERVRLDRWLWAARFFKTRAQAKTAIEGGKVGFHLSGKEAVGGSGQIRPKVSKEIGVGDMLTVRRGGHNQTQPQTVVVIALTDKRGSATVAAGLYQETDQSIEARESDRARRAMERVGLKVPQTKPSKRDRRALQQLKQESPSS